MDKALKTNEQATVEVKPLKVKKRKAKSLEKQKSTFGWLFILPFLLGFFLIYLPMIVSSIQISFSTIAYEDIGQVLTWCDPLFTNYSNALLKEADFTKTLVECLGGMAFDIPAIIIFSLFMAILLNQDMKGRAAFRAIFFVPVIVSTGIIESIDLQNTLAQLGDQVSNLNGDGVEGAVNAGTEIINAIDVERFFGNMKIGSELATVVSGWANNVYSIVNRSGVQMLIFLAALQSISPSIYESCKVEGATGWETFWKITFPMISPMILVNAIYTVIDAFTRQSNEVMKYIEEARGEPDGQTHATAMSWIYFLVVILMIGLVAGIMSTYVFYQRKE